MKSRKHYTNHIEQEVESKRSKLEQSENNLYSGRVHVPKELQDIQNEVASLKRFIAGLEDKQLEAMLTVESDQAEVEQMKIEFHKVESEVATDQASLRGELQRNKSAIERLAIEKNLLVKQISADNQSLYQKLRKSRKNIAVASVIDNSCSACGSTLTPADCQAAKSPQNIFFCPSCGRIVYGG
jgi:predicted  nucleic acid-binding Zn-ribbon protein